MGTMEARIAGLAPVEVRWFETEVLREDVRTAAPVMVPKPGWLHVDSKGHVHAFTAKQTDTGGQRWDTPTLDVRVRYEPCNGGCMLDGDCDGVPVREHFCTFCEEQIEPEYETGPTEHSIYLGTEFRLVLDTIPGTDKPTEAYQRWTEWQQSGAPLGVEFWTKSADGTEHMHQFGYGWPSREPLVWGPMSGSPIRIESAIERCRLWPVA
jgi:hypothetical protein